MSCVFLYNNTSSNTFYMKFTSGTIFNKTRNASITSNGTWSGSIGAGDTVYGSLNFPACPSTWTVSDTYFFMGTWISSGSAMVTSGYHCIWSSDDTNFNTGKSIIVQVEPRCVDVVGSDHHVQLRAFNPNFSTQAVPYNDAMPSNLLALCFPGYFYNNSTGEATFTMYTMCNGGNDASVTLSSKTSVTKYIPCNNSGYIECKNSSSSSGYFQRWYSTDTTYISRTPITITSSSSYKDTSAIPAISTSSYWAKYYFANWSLFGGWAFRPQENYNMSDLWNLGSSSSINIGTRCLYSNGTTTGCVNAWGYTSGYSWYIAFPTYQNYATASLNCFGWRSTIKYTGTGKTEWDTLTTNYNLAQPFTLTTTNWRSDGKKIEVPFGLKNNIMYMLADGTSTSTRQIPGLDYSGGKNTIDDATLIVPCFKAINKYNGSDLTVTLFDWTLPYNTSGYNCPVVSSEPVVLKNNNKTAAIKVTYLEDSTSKTTTIQPEDSVSFNLSLAYNNSITIESVEYIKDTKIYTTKFIDAKCYVYNGSKWVPAHPYVYKNSKWIASTNAT